MSNDAKLPEFEPNIPAHLLANLNDQDRWLHEQLSVTGQVVRHVANVQAESAAERRELVRCVRETSETVRQNHAEFVQHVAIDAQAFREVRAQLAAFKWLRLDTYFNNDLVTKLIVAVLTTIIAGFVVRHFLS